MSYRVAVVGATGAVGTVMLAKLRERGFPARELVPFASERSAGRELEGVGTVQPLNDETIQGFDLALFSAGATTSGEWAPRFVDAGCVVVDNSSRFRREEDIPLVGEVGENILFKAFCALADGAVSPISSTLQYFRDEYEAHVREGRCPVTGRGPGRAEPEAGAVTFTTTGPFDMLEVGSS